MTLNIFLKVLVKFMFLLFLSLKTIDNLEFTIKKFIIHLYN